MFILSPSPCTLNPAPFLACLVKSPEGISEAHLTGACRARAMGDGRIAESTTNPVIPRLACRAKAMGDGRIAESTAFAFVESAFQPRYGFF